MKWFAIFLLAVALAGAGCAKKSASSGGGAAGFVVQVVAVEAKRQPVSETLSLVGTIAANEMVEIKSETDGVVEEINFKEGERVEKGRLLLKLDESKFAAAVAEAEANFKLSQTTYERSKQLFTGNLISQQDFDQAAAQFQANQASLGLRTRQLKDARIYAPFSGVMGARNVSPGQVISRASPFPSGVGASASLTWLVDLDTVKVEINVPERFLSQLQTGQDIDVKVAAYPERKFAGKVFFVSPFVDAATRTALVKAEIANPKHELKPGMFGNLDLTLNIREAAVVIPEAALSQVVEGGRAMIYTVSETNTALLRPVKLGLRLAGQVEVVEGLNGGEKVIVEGIQKIGPGAKVKVAEAESTTTSVPSAGVREREKSSGASRE